MILTKKQEANKIIDKYFGITDVNFGFKEQKKCALIEIDAIISLNIKYHGREIEDNLHNINYWQEVKKEAEKMQV